MSKTKHILVAAAVAGGIVVAGGVSVAEMLPSASVPLGTPRASVQGIATPQVRTAALATPSVATPAVPTPALSTPTETISARIPNVALPVRARVGMAGLHNWSATTPAAIGSTAWSATMPALAVASKTVPAQSIAHLTVPSLSLGSVTAPAATVSDITVGHVQTSPSGALVAADAGSVRLGITLQGSK